MSEQDEPHEFTDQDQYFDTVDASDRVIGHATRRETHARGLLHRATHVMIYNADSHLFLQRRSMKKDKFPGCWDSSCSGHVDAGEDYFTAARRELVEELGWTNTTMPLREVIKLSASPETGQEFIQIYLLGPTIGPFVLNPEEISEGRWVTPVELDVMINQEPETVAGGLRFAWLYHREQYLARIWGSLGGLSRI
jgi:isopentenyl-diphosphate delta-isomerase type 1